MQTNMKNTFKLLTYLAIFIALVIIALGIYGIVAGIAIHFSILIVLGILSIVLGAVPMLGIIIFKIYKNKKS